MKKPKITEGEWRCVPITFSSEGGIAYEVLDKDRDNIAQVGKKANAKAMSAVPDMIDVLIKARECYQGVGDFEGCGEMMSQIMSEIEQALKKAGCQS